jgi:dienelactone hydrolase
MSDEDLLLPNPELQFGSGIIGVCDICGKRQAVIILQKERFKLCVLDFLNKSWLGSKAPPGRPLPPYRSERVWFATDASPTGKGSGVLLTPTKVVRRPCVLVTPDVYGLTSMVLDSGIRFARAGFEVLLPDVGRLDGLSPLDHPAIRSDVLLRGGLRVESPRVRKLVGFYLDALGYLRGRPMIDLDKTAVFGASYGGSIALALAGEVRNMTAVAVAFPVPVRPVEYLRLITAPVLFVSGEADRRALAARRQLESLAGPTGVDVTFESYAGRGHLFLSREHRGYNVASAEAAWARIVAFLQAKLLPPPIKPPSPPVVKMTNAPRPPGSTVATPSASSFPASTFPSPGTNAEQLLSRSPTTAG